MKTYIFTFFLIGIIPFTFAQVGIGTGNPDNSAILDISASGKGVLFPRLTTTQRNAITTPAIGLHVFDLTTNSLWFYTGAYWVNYATQSKSGDIKSGIQTIDHDGWVKLDGRAITSLSTSQQAVAISLGLTGSIPNAANSFLVQNGNAMGVVSGTNTATLTQANLPNVTFNGTAATAGNHAHTVDPPNTGTTTNGYHSHGSNANGGNGAGLQYQSGNNTPTSLDGDEACCEDDLNYTASLDIYGDGNHAHTVDIGAFNSFNNGDHTHNVTVASGGSATPVNITPKSLSVNMLIYLVL